MKKFILLTCLLVTQASFASQYNFKGLTGTNNDCTVSFDINNDNSLVNLKVSGAGHRADIGGPESIIFTTAEKFEYYGDIAYDQNYYVDMVFKMGAYEDGIIAKAKGGLFKQKNKIELKGQSIADLESMFIMTSDGYLKTKIGFFCEDLKVVK